MLREWLAPDDFGWFLRTHFQIAPLARPAAAGGAISVLDWRTLDGILRSDGPHDVMTVRSGHIEDVPTPRSLDAARGLLAAGISVVVRGAERHDPGLRALAVEFETALRAAGPGEVHVQVYATPGGTNSYGWHYDFEDVFIAQTAGAKDYYFRRNTVARHAALGERLDFTGIQRETTPIYHSRLLAGDWLYIPSTWWHLVKCAEDALSISVGVMPAAALRSARRLPPGWTGRTSSGQGRAPEDVDVDAG